MAHCFRQRTLLGKRFERRVFFFMPNCYSFLPALGAAVCLSTAAAGQSLVSGFMTGKGHGSVSVSVTSEQYKNVLLQPLKLYSVPVFEKVQVTSVNLFATYGLTNKLDAVLSLPYIKSAGRADERVISLGLHQHPRGRSGRYGPAEIQSLFA
jgi:hypothetical protein